MISKATRKGAVYKKSTLNPEDVSLQVAEIKPELPESPKASATSMINTCTKSTEVFGYDTEGKILQKETSKFPAGVRGSTKPQQIHFTTHEPRTAEQLAVLKKEGKPVEIHWWETAEHCSMLLETEFFESPEHEARIKLFRDLAILDQIYKS